MTFVVLGAHHVGPLAIGVLAMALFARGAGLQQSQLVLSVIEDLPRLALTSLLTVVALVALAPSLDGSMRLSIVADLWAAVALFVLLTVTRFGVYGVTNALRCRGLVARPVIIVGADDVGARLARALLDNPQCGLVPVGILDSRGMSDARLPVPLLGGLEDLDRAMINLAVDDVIFSFGSRRDEIMLQTVRRCVEADRQVFVVPRFFELMSNERHSRTHVVHGIPITRLPRWGWRRHLAAQKRAIDLVLASIGVILTAPVMIASAIMLRLETGAGVIFSQTRVGQHGENFTIYKFQTLRPATATASATTWSVDNDSRLGRVGRFLRRTGLDELPQLFNVLRGEMSIVGPRPERPHFVQEFSRLDARYADRHRAKVGITGWAQVNDLRGDTSITERVRFDNNYIENWSLWTDLKIMARTLPTFGRSQPAGRDLITQFTDAPATPAATEPAEPLSAPVAAPIARPAAPPAAAVPATTRVVTISAGRRRPIADTPTTARAELAATW